MISLKNLIRHLILEKMSFRDLLRHSDPKRIDRAKKMSTKSLGVQSNDQQERMTFSYKSTGGTSTTGNRHRGYIQFENQDLENHNSLEDVNCVCECSCPDFRYKYAYGLNKQGVSPIGSTALSNNNGQRPQNFDESNIGICKHLASLGSYLDTGISAPEPDYNQQKSVEKSVNRNDKKSIQPTTSAPSPDDDHTSPEDVLEPVTKLRPKYDTSKKQPKAVKPKHHNTYADSDETEPINADDRTGELSEDTPNKIKSSLYDKLYKFVKDNPQFNVPYPD